MFSILCKCCELTHKEDFDPIQTELKIEKVLSRRKNIKQKKELQHQNKYTSNNALKLDIEELNIGSNFEEEYYVEFTNETAKKDKEQVTLDFSFKVQPEHIRLDEINSRFTIRGLLISYKSLLKLNYIEEYTNFSQNPKNNSSFHISISKFENNTQIVIRLIFPSKNSNVMNSIKSCFTEKINLDWDESISDYEVIQKYDNYSIISYTQNNPNTDQNYNSIEKLIEFKSIDCNDYLIFSSSIPKNTDNTDNTISSNRLVKHRFIFIRKGKEENEKEIIILENSDFSVSHEDQSNRFFNLYKKLVN